MWSEIERLKRIVCEPRKAGDEFDAAIAQYYKAVQHDKGGLFMAVCRGKVGLCSAWPEASTTTAVHAMAQ